MLDYDSDRPWAVAHDSAPILCIRCYNPEKYLQGLPLYRLEDRYGREGAPIDRGTMCRWLEDVGVMAGVTAG